MIPRIRRYRTVLLAIAAVCGLAAAQETPKQDSVKLKNGNLLDGRILAETETSLTIRIGPGQEVEIPKQVIATYTRVSGPGPVAPDPGPAWHGRNAWFRLEDADGRVAGKLHIWVRPGEHGRLHLEQQWTFAGRARRTFLDRIETVDAGLRPVSFQYREVVSGRGGRLRREHLVRGRVRHGKLEIEEADEAGRRSRSIPFPAGNYLPMLVEELLRRGEAAGARSFSASVYDPAQGTFELRRYRLADGVPAPPVRGRPQHGRVRLVESTTDGRTQREWISPSGRILLLEVNGVHLVAEPISEATGQRLVAFDKEKGLPSWRRFGGLEVWLPRATWSFGRELVRGKVLDLRPGLPGCGVKLWYLPSGPGETILQAAAEGFLDRWRLDEPWFDEKSQDTVTVHGRRCTRIDGGGKDADGRLRLGRAYVLAAPGGYLVVSAQGPAPTWGFLAVEVDALVGALRARSGPTLPEPRR